MQGASEQCMQATEIHFSAPATPSLMVTTRRRFTPQGTSFSFLQAVTHPLHSIPRSAAHRDFLLAMVVSHFPRYARSIWQSVVFVSCVMGTGSKPHAVAGLTAYPP